jgi:hypothetical protein
MLARFPGVVSQGANVNRGTREKERERERERAITPPLLTNPISNTKQPTYKYKQLQ